MKVWWQSGQWYGYYDLSRIVVFTISLVSPQRKLITGRVLVGSSCVGDVYIPGPVSIKRSCLISLEMKWKYWNTTISYPRLNFTMYFILKRSPLSHLIFTHLTNTRQEWLPGYLMFDDNKSCGLMKWWHLLNNLWHNNGFLCNSY